MRVILVLPGSGVRRSSPTSLAGAEHLGLGSIASYLRHFGHDVEILNFQVEESLALPEDPVAYEVERILACDPEVVAMSITGLTIPQGLQVAGALKGARPDLHVVWGSHQASSCAEEILENEPAVDTIVAGDGEIPMHRLLDVLAEGGSLESVPGLWFRGPDGRPVLSSAPPEPALDGLPWPARDTLHQLADHGVPVHDARISSSRGCPFKCSFCVYPALGYLRRWRDRTADDLLAEMGELVEGFGIRQFWFSDDNFLLSSPRGRRRVAELAERLAEADLGITYRVLMRADAVDGQGELLAALARSGLTCVYLGIESGSPRRLDYFDKHADPQVYERAIRLIRRHRIGLQIGFIMFDPLTTWEDLEIDAAFLHGVGEMYLFTNYAQVLLVYPGTPITARLADRGLLPAGFGYASGYREYRYVDERVGVLGELLHALNDERWTPVDDFFRRLRMIDVPALFRHRPEAAAEAVHGLVERHVGDLNEAGYRCFRDLLERARNGEGEAGLAARVEEHRQDSLRRLEVLAGELVARGETAEDFSALALAHRSGYRSASLPVPPDPAARILGDARP